MADKKNVQNNTKELPETPWGIEINDVAERLSVDREKGLSPHEASKRRQHYGANQLRRKKRRSTWKIFIDQVKSLLIILLTAAAVLAFATDRIVEGSTVLAVIVLNTVIGFIMELRAVRSMEALKQIGKTDTVVVRNGSDQVIRAQNVVPGDIVKIRSGDVITADIRLFKSDKLQANESVLTGETLPVSKQTSPIEKKNSLADRTNMLFKGTAITRGSGIGIVVATGMSTELGTISSLVQEVESKPAKLQKDIDRLAKRLTWLTLIIAALIFIIGFVAGRQLVLIIETAIALAVATVPEGLPIVATVALANGMRKMARKNALIRQLTAVQTLGSTSIILTDKTGTLTENKMTLSEIASNKNRIGRHNGDGGDGFFSGDNQVTVNDDAFMKIALTVGALCNNASVVVDDGKERAEGEPMEVALHDAARVGGLDPDKLREEMKEEREEAFDPDTKMMATFNRRGEKLFVAVKGAPEAVLDACEKEYDGDRELGLNEESRKEWQSLNSKLAEEGLRVLALAKKEVDSIDVKPYEKLTLIGMVGLLDPPRNDIHDAMDECHNAGVRVIMITGDHSGTAKKIAEATGLVIQSEDHEVERGEALQGVYDKSEEQQQELRDISIFARTSPKQKLELISLHQSNGDVVAMIGDGVNDAPALKKADIGVAMGKRGTQVAKDAADMVLLDDKFGTIVLAIRYGRAIFENIRKFITYLLSLNMGEIIAIGIASILNIPLPILPLQILYINLITDVLPALAMGVGPAKPGIMNEPPRDPKEPILTKHSWVSIGGYGLLMALLSIGALGIGLSYLGMDKGQAVSVSFLTISLSQLWHVFNVRSSNTSVFNNEIIKNKWIWGALALSVPLVIATAYVPGLSDVLKVQDPGGAGWLVVIVMSLLTVIIGQLSKIVLGRVKSK